MNKPLLAHDVAVWLVDNTSLTFEQIADYCQLHVLEIRAIANGEVSNSAQGVNPVIMGELTFEEIAKCEKNPKLSLQRRTHKEFEKMKKNNKSTYTSIALREQRKGAILWLVKNHPELSDSQISGLLRSTPNTVKSIRGATAADFESIQQINPVTANLINIQKYNETLLKAAKKLQQASKQV